MYTYQVEVEAHPTPDDRQLLAEWVKSPMSIRMIETEGTYHLCCRWK